MSGARLLMYLPMALLLLCGAVTDLRARRIPNWVSFGLLVAGLAQSVLGLGAVSAASALGGVGVGFGLLLLPYVMGGLAAGDVKLLSGVGAWVGPGMVIEVFAASAVIGLFVVLIQAAWQGKLWALFRNTAVLALTLVHAKRLGAAEVVKSGRQFKSVDRPVPYAVLVLAGTVAMAIGPWVWLR